VRLFCSFMMEYDIHTLLDFLTLVATGAPPACPIVAPARMHARDAAQHCQR
jgi:hypothetical protein